MTRSNLLQVALVLAVGACGETATEPRPAEVERPGSPAFAAVANSWITRLDMPSIERFRLAAATVPNAAGQSILYAIGGATESRGSLSKVQAYNAATNTWSHKAPLPVPLYWTNGAAVIRGKIYVSGGTKGSYVYSAELYVYDPATNRWTRKADMPHETFAGVSGVINGQLYVLTTCIRNDCPEPPFTSVGFFRYDPVTDRWTTLPRPMRADGSPIDHQWGMGGVIGGKFYVVGGYGTNRLDVYDPVTDQWTERASMPSNRYDGAGLALQGKLYVIGGERWDSPRHPPVRTTRVYDPLTDTWTNKAPMPTARSQIAASRVVVNGQPRVEVVGGKRPGNNLQYIP